MRDVVLDANVIVGLLDSGDSQHTRASGLLERLQEEGARVVVLDFILEEALSVLCRRATQRRTHPPDLRTASATMLLWIESGEVQSTVQESVSLTDVIDLVSEIGGRLNSNDARLVLLQRRGRIGEVATFDDNLRAAPDFVSVS